MQCYNVLYIAKYIGVLHKRDNMLFYFINLSLNFNRLYAYNLLKLRDKLIK